MKSGRESFAKHDALERCDRGTSILIASITSILLDHVVGNLNIYCDHNNINVIDEELTKLTIKSLTFDKKVEEIHSLGRLVLSEHDNDELYIHPMIDEIREKAISFCHITNDQNNIVQELLSDLQVVEENEEQEEHKNADCQCEVCQRINFTKTMSTAQILEIAPPILTAIFKKIL